MVIIIFCMGLLQPFLNHYIIGGFNKLLEERLVFDSPNFFKDLILIESNNFEDPAYGLKNGIISLATFFDLATFDTTLITTR